MATTSLPSKPDADDAGIAPVARGPWSSLSPVVRGALVAVIAVCVLLAAIAGVVYGVDNSLKDTRVASNNDFVGLNGALLRVSSTTVLVPSTISEANSDAFLSRVQSLRAVRGDGMTSQEHAVTGWARVCGGAAVLFSSSLAAPFYAFAAGAVHVGTPDEVAALAAAVSTGDCAGVAWLQPARPLAATTNNYAVYTAYATAGDSGLTAAGNSGCPAGSFNSGGTGCVLVRGRRGWAHESRGAACKQPSCHAAHSNTSCSPPMLHPCHPRSARSTLTVRRGRPRARPALLAQGRVLLPSQQRVPWAQPRARPAPLARMVARGADALCAKLGLTRLHPAPPCA